MKIKIVLASVGSYLSWLFGGWDILLQWLITFMIADYFTGLIKSMIQGKLSSKVGFIGIAKKIGILIVVATSHGLDQLFADPEANIFNIDMPLIRTIVIWAYIVNEVISILENVKEIGVPAPKFLQKVLDMVLNTIENKPVENKAVDSVNLEKKGDQ